MPSLEEVAKKLYTLEQAQQGAIRASRMRELAALLEKHPDIARILELMEEV